MSNAENLAVWRIIDANIHRASEGLRVIEEFWRFAANDPILAREIKNLRHNFLKIVRAIDTEQRIAARDTQGDVGTTISASDEYQRPDMAAVVAANWERVIQSLRVLEEYGKVVNNTWPAKIEALRYQTYTLSKAGFSLARNRERLADARLYLLIDASGSESEFDRRVEQALEIPADIIQLRDKQIDDRTLLQRARHLCRRATARPVATTTPKARALVIINDRPDIAALSRADGVHVGQDELSVADARKIVGPNVLVGVSTHSPEQVRQAVLDGADYIGCGPTFPSGTKSFAEFPGLEFLTWVANECTLPAFAIGGIQAANLDEVLRVGIARVAMSGGIWNAPHPVEEGQKIRGRLFGP